MSDDVKNLSIENSETFIYARNQFQFFLREVTVWTLEDFASNSPTERHKMRKFTVGKRIPVENDVLEKQANEVEGWILNKYPHVKELTVSVDDKWIQVLINEDEVHMMDVINCIQNNKKIVDMNLQEISTESIIHKIYEGK